MASPLRLSEIHHHANFVIKDNFFSFLSLTVILGIFFSGVVTIGINIFLSVKNVLHLFLAICAFSLLRFITSPVFVGVYEWISRISKGDYTPMHNVFSRFSDLAGVLESQKLLFLLFPLWFISFIPFLMTLLLIVLEKTGDIYHTVFYVLISFLASLKLFSFLFPLPHILITARQVPFFKAIILSYLSMRGCFGAFMRLICEYIVMTVLSIIFVGIPFIYTLPYISCSAVIFCDSVFEENKIYKYNLYY